VFAAAAVSGRDLLRGLEVLAAEYPAQLDNAGAG